MKTRKEGTKLTLFETYLIGYINNQKILQKNYYNYREFKKVAGYKVNIQNSIPFLYLETNLENLIFKETSFTVIKKKSI